MGIMNLENVKFNTDTKLVLNIGDPMGKTNAPRAYNKLFGELDMNAIMLPEMCIRDRYCKAKQGDGRN